MNKTLKILRKTAQIDVIRQLHCFIDSRNIQNVYEYENDFKSYDKLVNAGGFDVKGLYFMPCDINSTGGATTPLGGGNHIPKLGEARYSDINPGIDDFLK